MRFATFINENSQVWLHGRSVNSDIFDYKFINPKGALQDGPGFYFTDDEQDADQYTGKEGIILKCELNPRKILTQKSKISPSIIKQMIKKAPDINDSLMDWDEYPTRAFNLAYSQIIDNDDVIDIFQNIWATFYTKKPNGDVIYLKNMVALGIDGTEPRTEFKARHLIIFNPAVIKVIGKI